MWDIGAWMWRNRASASWWLCLCACLGVRQPFERSKVKGSQAWISLWIMCIPLCLFISQCTLKENHSGCFVFPTGEMYLICSLISGRNIFLITINVTLVDRALSTISPLFLRCCKCRFLLADSLKSVVCHFDIFSQRKHHSCLFLHGV